MRVFRGLWSNCVCASFPFAYEGGMSDVIVIIPDHCLSIYFRCDVLLFIVILVIYI